MEYKIPVPEDHEEHPNFSQDARGRKWPTSDFMSEPATHFTTLYQLFNTTQQPLQNPEAFFTDVCEVAHASNSIDELFIGLEKRKKERREQLNQAWKNIVRQMNVKELIRHDEGQAKARIPPGSNNHDAVEQDVAFHHLAEWASFESLIDYFGGFVRDKGKAKDEGQASWLRSVEDTAGEHQGPEPSSNPSAPITAASANPNDRPRLTSSSSRHGQRRATEAPFQTAESSTARKRKSDDDDAEEPGRKRRRAMSEGAGDDDGERLATQQRRFEAAEPTSSTSQRPDESEWPPRFRDPRRFQEEEPFGTQLPRQGSPVHVYPPPFEHSAVSTQQSWHTAAEHPAPRLDTAAEQGVQNSVEMPSPSSPGRWKRSRSPESINLWSIEPSQAPPQRDAEEHLAMDTVPNTAEARRLKRKSRANHRQRVNERRSTGEEQEASSSSSPVSRKKRQERKIPRSVDQLLRSRRSSRRDSGWGLLFLGDDDTPCVASNRRKRQP
ncbi:hypothetical protein V8C35DRAFT_290252 [Trichoderma chlorosporum]